MAETKFTPAPWVVEGDMVACHPATENGIEVCFMADHRPGDDGSERLANSRLIAAAPELYEALADIVAICDDDYGDPDLSTAKAALAKARGE